MIVSRPGDSLPNEGRVGIKPATLQHTHHEDYKVSKAEEQNMSYKH
jgi:hypothetical protein